MTDEPSPGTFAVRECAASAVLFTDTDGRVLLVEPTYKKGWEFPGGALEPGESPWQAAVREVREELGLEVTGAAVPLCVDWACGSGGTPGALRLVFEGGTLSPQQVAAIRLPPAELRSWRLASVDEAQQLLPPVRMRRLRAALRGRAKGAAQYLETAAVHV